MKKLEKCGYRCISTDIAPEYNRAQDGTAVITMAFGEYKGRASTEGYSLEDGTDMNLCDKDQIWIGLTDAYMFYKRKNIYL